MRSTFLIILLFLFCIPAYSSEVHNKFKLGDTLLFLEDIKQNEANVVLIEEKSWKLKTVNWINKNVGERKKVVAAVLAFPIFGVVGLHRIYMGTKPYVPVVYIATIGGCFGIIPFIDFCTIIFSDSKTFESYQNNPKVLMWVN